MAIISCGPPHGGKTVELIAVARVFRPGIVHDSSRKSPRLKTRCTATTAESVYGCQQRPEWRVLTCRLGPCAAVRQRSFRGRSLGSAPSALPLPRLALRRRCACRRARDQRSLRCWACLISCFSDHVRGLSATKESPFTVYAATMMWLSKASKSSSCPLRDHIGYAPPLFEICHLPPVSGKART